MTHLELDQFQALLNQKTPRKQRDPMVSHILECDACANRFRALKALENALPNPAKPKRHIIRYGLGAAAVMIMAISPYFSKNLNPSSPTYAGDDRVIALQDTETFAVTQKILKVNYKAALTHWAENKDVLQLVNLQNQTGAN